MPVTHYCKVYGFQPLKPLTRIPFPKWCGFDGTSSPRYRNRYTHRAKFASHAAFQYTTRGHGCFRDATGVYDVGEGQGFLFLSDDEQAEYFYPPSARDPWEFLYIAIFGGNEMFGQLIDTYGPVFRLPMNSSFVYAMHGLDAGEVDTAGDLTAHQGLRLVHQLVEDILANLSQPEPDSKALHYARQVDDIVRSNFKSNLNARQVAARIGISPRYLAICFQEVYGVKVSAHIERIKMERACRLCKFTNLQNQEVAEQLGFEFSSNFTRTFKRVVGMTPSAYRKHGVFPPF